MLEIRSPNSWKVSFLVLLTNPFPSISILTSLISKRFLLFFIFYHLYEYSLLYWFASSRTTTISSKWVYGSLTRNGLMECGTDCPSTWLSRNEKSQIPKYHLFGSRKKCSSTLLCFRIIWIITPMRSNTSFRILLHPVPVRAIHTPGHYLPKPRIWTRVVGQHAHVSGQHFGGEILLARQDHVGKIKFILKRL